MVSFSVEPPRQGISASGSCVRGRRDDVHEAASHIGLDMIVWFSSITLLGLGGIANYPSVLRAMNPWYALDFFLRDGVQGFLILGSVVLVVTGGEALYADMGR